MAGQITVSLAVDELRDAAKTYRRFEEQKAAALKRRNDAIRDAAAYIPLTTIAGITGLTREQIYRIRTSPVQD